MPELPEVETVRRGLTRLVGGATIQSVTVLYPKMVSPEAATFVADLTGKTIEKIDRRGKYLLFRFNGDLTMVSHLRMEGKYDVQPAGSPVTKHTHVVFTLTDGRELRYTDTRKFGRMRLMATGKETTLPGLATMGPEPTEATLTFDYMKQRFQKSKKAIKPFLLDQSNIAGLGNIYVDETLWMSRIHPLQEVNTLPDFQIRQLRENIIKELNMAILGHGTTVHSFSTAFGEAGEFQNHLRVYGRKGLACQRCGTPIEKTKVAQRGTAFCPACQKYHKHVKQTMILGLTGGIATGKSTVSAVFREFDIPVIDADAIAHSVLAPGSDGVDQVWEAFGDRVFEAGQLNRKALGHIVFNDADELKRLTDITGPLISAAIKAAVSTYRRKHANLVVLDAPTLFEAGYAAKTNEIMVVKISAAQQLQRLMARDDLSEDQAESRIKSQLPLQNKIEKADVVIDNSGSVETTRVQVVEWLDKMGFIKTPAEDSAG
ncbi:DNA-formamidopyrimidine glycosylase [Secundilactobacillus kimchicus]|nr:DNA-formamidopyrimidine glycosylase [Secundilactobacillus kimchicus]